ncbi:amidohydrolase [Cellulomonas carbonis T26]|uniref:Amidohydrolase n=1 Tax=Cellulomonas carbonis T26 TaxID=947969 RepID=A0A0A0BYW5_9CELL|nr:amidohydrolase [Cellulomonas carbonis T26]
MVDVDVRGGAVDGPVDVVLADGRVHAVGRPGETLAAPRGAEVVDLDGRWVLPGLWDNHVHMGQWALARRRYDVSAASSAPEAAAMVVARLRERAGRADAATRPHGAHEDADPDLFVAVGFRDGLWPEAPTAAVLDDAIAAAGLPPTPVVVMCGDLHSAWLSTAALRRLGVTRQTTGVLREDDWFPLMSAVHEVPRDVLDEWVADAAAAAAARGVVGIVDFELDDNVTAWRRRVEQGTRDLRVAAAVWREHLDGAVARGLETGDVVPGTHGLVTQGPFKVISDGSLNTRTAFCHDPYPGVDGPDAHGVLNVATEELVPLMTLAARHGLHAAIHAIGDRATALALDAFGASGAVGSIEHAQMVAPNDVVRFADLGVTASVQPEHAMDDRDVVERYWADRADRVFPLRTLHRAGVRLVLGSDAPVAPLDPWQAVSAAVDRARDGREPWRPDEALPIEVALAASVRSRVEPGRPADVVVVDADPLTTRGDALRTMPVAGTLLAGRWTHRTL